MALEHTNVIDLLAHDPVSDEVALIIVEKRPWDGSDLQLFQLQEKLNTYLSFALDGEMAEAYPDMAQKQLRIQLECLENPDPRTTEFLEVVKKQIAFQGINFALKISLKAGDCGDGCGCGNSKAHGKDGDHSHPHSH